MWYSVNIFFVSKHPSPQERLHQNSSDDQPTERLWEEQILLVQAIDGEEARAKAENYGRKAEHTYQNSEGDVVEWSFHALGQVYEILEDSIADGVEVFARFLKTEEAHSLLRPFED